MELHLNDDCSMFAAGFSNFLAATEGITGGPTSNSESNMIIVDSQPGANHDSFASTKGS